MSNYIHLEVVIKGGTDELAAEMLEAVTRLAEGAGLTVGGGCWIERGGPDEDDE